MLRTAQTSSGKGDDSKNIKGGAYNKRYSYKNKESVGRPPPIMALPELPSPSAAALRKRGLRHIPQRGQLVWRKAGKLPGTDLSYELDFPATGHPRQLDANNIDASAEALYPPDATPAKGLERLNWSVRNYLQQAQADSAADVPALLLAFRKVLRSARDLARVELELAAKFSQWQEAAQEAQRAVRIEKALGLADYPAIFTEARMLRRHFVILVGPTNSGKTHRALSALASAGSGAYLAPLRLLALEGQEALFERGVLANLITGEERRTLPGATHTASTVEMADFWKPVDCAVIDEAQLLTDPDRGWAWTAAICGIPAKTVYLVGAPELVDRALPLLHKLQDTWEVYHFERKTPLRVETKPCPLELLRPGDAVIAFSRREVLALRDDIKRAGRSVAVVYGALTPEVRRAEARRFATGQAEVLVATDAIGMGLNLPIHRVVFSTAKKFDGSADRLLSAAEAKQIAGRAGRFGMAEFGEVTAFDAKTLASVRDLLAAPVEASSNLRVAIAPNPAHVVEIARLLDTTSLGTVLEFFRNKLVRDDPLFRTAELEDSIRLAWLADGIKNLSLETRFAYACAPLDRRNDTHMQCFFRWLHAHAKGQFCRLPELPNWAFLGPTEAWLYEAEGLTKLASVYSWLAYRFPDHYPDADRAAAQRRELSSYIESVLSRKSKARQRA